MTRHQDGSSSTPPEDERIEPEVMMVLVQMIFLFQGSILRFHVNLPGLNVVFHVNLKWDVSNKQPSHFFPVPKVLDIEDYGVPQDNRGLLEWSGQNDSESRMNFTDMMSSHMMP